MTFFVFLNELSHPAGNIDPQDAKDLVRRLVRVLRSVKRIRDDTALHSHVKLKDIPLGSGLYLASIFYDCDSREEWQFLRTLDNRAPFRIGLPGDEDFGVEYEYQTKPAVGLGLAYQFRGLAVSFFAEQWEQSSIEVVRKELSDGANGQLDFVAENVHVTHASIESHVAEIASWCAKIPIDNVTTGTELWEKRETLFPNLRFLHRTESQISTLKAATLTFEAVKQRLNELNLAIGQWPSEQASPEYHSRVTPEYEQRKNLCWFSDGGAKQLFELHARFTPGCGRIHFRLDNAVRGGVIAHVGDKL